jgi:hypothetical protein
MEGAEPESVQVTVNDVPPGREAPAAGTVNLTSANAREKQVTKKRGGYEYRMMIMCDLCAKRVTC